MNTAKYKRIRNANIICGFILAVVGGLLLSVAGYALSLPMDNPNIVWPIGLFGLVGGSLTITGIYSMLYGEF